MAKGKAAAGAKCMNVGFTLPGREFAVGECRTMVYEHQFAVSEPTGVRSRDMQEGNMAEKSHPSGAARPIMLGRKRVSVQVPVLGTEMMKRRMRSRIDRLDRRACSIRELEHWST